MNNINDIKIYIDSLIERGSIRDHKWRYAFLQLRKIYYQHNLSKILLSEKVEEIRKQLVILKNIFDLVIFGLTNMIEIDTDEPNTYGGDSLTYDFKLVINEFFDLSSTLKLDIFYASNHLISVKQSLKVQHELEKQGKTIQNFFKSQLRFVSWKVYSLLILAIASPIIAALLQIITV